MSYGKRKDFYLSPLWKRVRRSVWLKQYCLCYLCNKPVYVYGISDPNTPKEKRVRGIIHHKEHLTEANLMDDSIAIDEANLVGLCFNCHTEAHIEDLKRGSRTAIRQGFTFDEDGNLIKAEAEEKEKELWN